MPKSEKPSAGGPSPSRKAQNALGNKLNRPAKQPPTIPGHKIGKKDPPARRTTDEVAALLPDFSRLAGLDAVLGVNCIAGSGTHWKTRMFAPAAGVTEDPATGSAAGPLALHLARHGRIAFGDEIEISQGVEIGRPSTLFARVDGSADQVERVEVGGSAVIVSRGELKL